ncbi:MAG: tubulin/FtsZ family protein [Dehalogenimonas sp.]|uniref:Tubulin-like protein CetZ n=1 Tax=Candidatus Dehalogenimonas loeffleri TaxID=3127115 RepID=A0ABZ2J660_9CHLR|nr:tubulin/FtsZ family protein [Dehalogenimonas sp.]
MKLMVVGCGQCGGRIADQFSKLNRVAHVRRGVDIATNVVAVNSDVADLSGLEHIRADYQHRILIGSQKTSGHGVGKINEMGAEIARDDGDKLIEAIKNTPNFGETDAFLLIAGAAGGTGSGSISVLSQQIKERFPEKPVYNMLVLPFAYEEATEERSVFNVGICLKSCYLVADAIFLVDNQRFIKASHSLRANLDKINYHMVKPFYNLLCAGEEKNSKYIGSKVMDGGDIIQTLSGWTVIGFGQAKTPNLRFSRNADFREQSSEVRKGAEAINAALADLSLRCNPTDAKRGLYLLTAAQADMSMDLINEMSGALKGMATEATIRTGDYPRGDKTLDVTVVLSELVNSSRVMDYFSKTISYINNSRRRQSGLEYGFRGVEDSFKDIPSLL